MFRAAVVALSVAAGACASSGAVPRPFPGPGGTAGSPPVAAGNPPADPGSRTPDPGPRPGFPGSVTPDPGSRTPDPGSRSGSPVDTYALTGTALALRGAPYRNGGSDPSGFDCSGFVWYVFAQHGVSVPRTVSELYRAGQSADGGLLPGDLVFFSTVAPGPSHVGISIGGDEFIHAPSSQGIVRVERISASYWANKYVGARRIK